MRVQRVAALLAAPAALVAVLVLTGCTEEPPPLPPDATPDEQPAPAPPSGLKVGVVLPPGDPELDRQLQDLRTEVAGLGSTLPEGFSQLRTVLADGRAFVPDVAALLVRQETDLVCVLGPDGRRTVVELAKLYPERRFCAAPGHAEDPPEGVVLVDVRFEELGHVVGVAAAAVAGDGDVGAVVGTDRTGRSAFLAGLEAAVGERRLRSHEAASAEEAEVAVRTLLEDDVAVVVIDVGSGGVELLALAAEQALVLAPRPLLVDSDAVAAAVLSWRVRWSSLLRLVLVSVVEGDTEPPTSLGLADDAMQVTLGQAATIGVGSAVDRAVEELRQGTRDPLVPLHTEDEEDEEDEDADAHDAAEVAQS